MLSNFVHRQTRLWIHPLQGGTSPKVIKFQGDVMVVSSVTTPQYRELLPFAPYILIIENVEDTLGLLDINS